MSHKLKFRSIVELLLVALFVALLAWQMFVPPIVGGSDNGDFPKVAGTFCLAAPGHEDSWYKYFEPVFEKAPSNCWQSGIPTSEMLPAAIAVPAGLRLSGGKQFDIRYLGALHAALLVIAYWLFLRAVRPLKPVARVALGLVAAWIFADTQYVAYLNSFYTDTAALLGLVLMAGFAVWVARDPSRFLPLLLCGASAVFFVASKTQHAVCGPLLAVLAIACFIRIRRTRWASLTVAIALLAATGWTFYKSPEDVSVLPRFNLIFGRLAYEVRNRSRTLVELGLGREDLKYIGMHAYMDGNPTADPNWRKRFRRAGYSRIAVYYLRHPERTARILSETLKSEAGTVRAFAAYRRQDGFPAYTLASRFSTWSDLRRKLFSLWPWHVVVWLMAIMLGSIWILVRRADVFASRLAWISLTVVTLAAGEYVVSSLADVMETFRHLFIFHVMTDVATLFAVTALCAWLFNARPRESRGLEPSGAGASCAQTSGAVSE